MENMDSEKCDRGVIREKRLPRGGLFFVGKSAIKKGNSRGNSGLPPLSKKFPGEFECTPPPPTRSPKIFLFPMPIFRIPLKFPEWKSDGFFGSIFGDPDQEQIGNLETTNDIVDALLK